MIDIVDDSQNIDTIIDMNIDINRVTEYYYSINMKNHRRVKICPL